MTSSNSKANKGASRSVANPNSSGNKGFWVALSALVLIGALVIGLIVYNGRSAQADRIAEKVQPVEGVSMELTDNIITLSAAPAEGEEANTKEAKEAGIYEDLACHYCAELAKATDDDMLAKIKAGDLKVNIHPLTFLDGTAERYSPNRSTHSLAALLALADKGEVEAYWNLRKILLEQQDTLYTGTDDNKLADLAREVGASKGAVEAIRNGEYLERAKEIGDANQEDLVDKTGQLSSPRVLVDGKDVDSDPLENWITDLFS